jgi:hypothetical protein
MIHFTDFFSISEEVLEEYGAFNVSLINDLPLFIDPFLLFGSDNPKYQKLHKEIIKYLKFLKNKSEDGVLNDARLKSWYKFSEVKQNWLGYSMIGNKGSGLGYKFGSSMSKNMNLLYRDLGNEKITESSHLEKAGLFQIGVGRDNISDFTCNLIKSFLLEYSEAFAIKYLKKNQMRELNISKAYFDYELERWMPKKYILPYIFKDFVLLSPKDILTKDENWINSKDLHSDFSAICTSIPNDQLRSEINNYFYSKLPRKTKKKGPSQKEINQAILKTLQSFPSIVDYFIKYKEDQKSEAKNISESKVLEVQDLFVKNVSKLVLLLSENSEFYSFNSISSYDEAYNRIIFLKNVIEENDGYKIFYSKKGIPLKRESDLQIIFRLTWFGSPLDVNREPNNGRGPVDYAISYGAKNKSLVEFKLASNSQLKRNLRNQTGVYEKANRTGKSIKVILYFTKEELTRVESILKELKLGNDDSIVLIDARKDNKQSASKVKNIM